MHSWQKIFHSIAGWNPTMEFIPPAAAAVIFYLSVYLIGQILRQIINHVVPSVLKEYLHDFVKTVVFCAYPFGHGIARKFFGEPGYFIAMVPLVFMTTYTYPEGNGNPIGVWLKFYKKQINLLKTFIFTFIEVLSGLVAYRLGMLIFALELHPFYVMRLSNYYKNHCESDMRVPMYVGFLVEFFAMIYVTWFSGQRWTKNKYVNTILETINGGILVSCGVHLTGMYMHPAMATGHTFGCGQTYRATHILIYWIGPMIGAWCSVQLQKFFSVDLYGESKAGKQSGKAKNRNENGKGKPAAVRAENGHQHENGVKKRKTGKRKFYQQ